jgi:hypothetical protein
MEDIKTAVDSLIELVKKEKKISVDKAAEQLNLPVVIVHEWATFLEEAKVVKIEYKLSTPYLKILGKSKTDEVLKQNKEEIEQERETLMIRTQANLKDIQSKKEYLNWLKTQFIELSTVKKKRLAKPLSIVLDQKELLEENIYELLIELKKFKVNKQTSKEFNKLRERFKKIGDRSTLFDQNLQKMSNYIGSVHH